MNVEISRSQHFYTNSDPQAHRHHDVPTASFQAVHARVLTDEEKKRLSIIQQAFRDEREKYEHNRTKIKETLELVKKYPPKSTDVLGMAYLYNRVESKVPELDQFFKRYSKIVGTASGLRKLENALTWYQESGDGKKLIELTLKDLESRDSGTVPDERDSLTSITGYDEAFFNEYLRKPKSAQLAYRGDGRGVNEHFLDDYQPADVIAGGTTDISFYGVVEHTHTSTAKNGMVSTTTEEGQAKKWAMDDHNYGVVYEFELKNYIHVANLLAERKFKDRFAAQKEILVPGNIPASAIKSVSLYGKVDGSVQLIRKKEKATGWR